MTLLLLLDTEADSRMDPREANAFQDVMHLGCVRAVTSIVLCDKLAGSARRACGFYEDTGTVVAGFAKEACNDGSMKMIIAPTLAESKFILGDMNNDGMISPHERGILFKTSAEVGHGGVCRENDGPAFVVCENTCDYAGDGTCDDGGYNSTTTVCSLGTDCEDCGERMSDMYHDELV